MENITKNTGSDKTADPIGTPKQPSFENERTKMTDAGNASGKKNFHRLFGNKNYDGFYLNNGAFDFDD